MYTDYMENKGKETQLGCGDQMVSQHDIQASPIWELYHGKKNSSQWRY